uniref:C1q domain-containing protein n=1 Tax=Magallana gigas TaxID=29159 RepID=A0A8W8J9E6_MAGGI
MGLPSLQSSTLQERKGKEIEHKSAFQKDISVDIVLNGSVKVQAMTWYGSGSSVKFHQTGTNLVILHLTTGDRVWVKRSGGTGYFSYGTQETTFSGF